MTAGAEQTYNDESTVVVTNLAASVWLCELKLRHASGQPDCHWQRWQPQNHLDRWWRWRRWRRRRWGVSWALKLKTVGVFISRLEKSDMANCFKSTRLTSLHRGAPPTFLFEALSECSLIVLVLEPIQMVLFWF